MRVRQEAEVAEEAPAELRNGEGFEFSMPDAETAAGIAVDYGIPAIKVILILLAAWVVAAWARRVMIASLDRAKMEPTISRFTGNFLRWTILALALIAVLGVFGIPTATFAVMIGSLGLAIGLALQGTLGNAASGFLLLIFRPFKVGDVITAAGVTGKVVEIELFSTMIDTFDNRRFILPNGAIFGSTIENVSHHARRRVDVSVGVAYDSDLKQTREVLTAAAMSNEHRLDDPVPAIVLTELADSSVNWTVRIWVEAANFWPAKEQLTERIKQSLDDAAISIPFPQMDVHFKPTESAGSLAK